MHHWQDFVFTIGNIVFAVSLIPSLRSQHKPALGTSLPTAIVLVFFAFSFSTLSLWFSTVASSTTGIMWFILAWQRYRQSGSTKRQEVS